MSNRYFRFWQALLDSAKSKTSLHRNISPGTSNWVSTAADMPTAFGLGYVLAYGKGRVELYIDDEKMGKAFNEAVFHSLETNRSVIEAEFGGPLNWEELSNGRACRVCKRLDAQVDLDDEATWPAFINQMVDAMIRLDKAVRPFLGKAIQEAEELIKEQAAAEESVEH